MIDSSLARTSVLLQSRIDCAEVLALSQQEQKQQLQTPSAPQQQQQEQWRQPQERLQRLQASGEQPGKEEDNEREGDAVEIELELKLPTQGGGGSLGYGSSGGRRRSPGRVTRVVGDLMVFVEVTAEDGPLGLVFKPNKIVDYRGETLNELGGTRNADLLSVEWDTETLKVLSVEIASRTETQTAYAMG